MDKRYVGALVANSASLGHHWIYNTPFLESESKKRDLLFQKQNQDVYDRGKPSYFVYPNADIGDFSTQGMFFKWLYEDIIKKDNYSKNDYITMLYEHIRPGGDYEGYIESYAKKMVIESLYDDLKIAYTPFEKDDTHLVNFIPYMVCKLHQLPKEKAWEIAQAFTEVEDFFIFYEMFDELLSIINEAPLKTSLKKVIPKAPKHFQEALYQALDMDDTKAFIKDYAGIACYISQSIPLIFHILSHTTSYEEMVHWNTKIGGASSDRGLLLGFIMSMVSDVPKAWIKLTHL